MRARWTSRGRAAALILAALGAQGCNLIAGLDDVKFEGAGGSGGNTATQGGGGSGGGTTSSTDTGGSGGTTSSTETASTTTTSTGETTSSTSTTTTTTASGPVVQCNYPDVSDCSPGQVCCYDKSGMPGQDFCGAPGDCQPSAQYAELQCENNEDCPGEVCCLYFVLDPNNNPQVQATYCDATCDDDQELKTCQSDADCTFPVPCDLVFSSAYPAYKACFP